MKYSILLFCLCCITNFGVAQSIHGRVFDKEYDEGLPFAHVILLKKGVQINGTTTDLDGNYRFDQLDPGTYEVVAVYVGYPNARIADIKVTRNSQIPVDIGMEGGEELEPIIGCCQPVIWKIPLIRPDKTSTGETWSADEIRHFAF